LRTLVESATLAAGTYRLVFDTRRYFERRHVPAFYPSIVVIFEVGSDGHYHVPLLLSPFGYSTYRGS
jgi:5-hydroxyisourate hydrolase